jgi:hypothetical protein
VIEEIQQPNGLLVHQETEEGAIEASILITPYDGNPGIDITQVRGGSHGSIFVLVDGVDDLVRAIRRAAKDQRERLTQVERERAGRKAGA